ncbi:alpha/beta fold hydrolase [Rhabdothermincola salaria]|uniref:alpha/beta fold hydrolase n=1 Tax=Rhabdothermincola salaria TaxID=2903142 RepID=UPI001E4C496C|nr:alpha/beta hydrolase [Rhabdothermincola salaria]MCD9623001.1 alpha/beta fold hydrolase [Rhabdothermincola salaria]
MTPPVVLVHGFATSAARTWGDNGWLDILADVGREVLAPDLLGHATAERPTDPEAYDALEAHLLERLPAEPVDAVGFSLGARTLLLLASAHPERFHSLVVAGVGANLFRDDGSSEMIAAAIEGRAPADDPVARYFATLAEAPDQEPAALAALMRRPRSQPLTDEGLARITCPVLVVLGDQDFAGPADPLLERLATARLVSLRGVDHFATPKNFGFIDAVLEFLEAGG